MIVVPEERTSMVVPRLINSADSTDGKSITGAVANEAVLEVSMLIGDCVFEVEQATLDGSRAAQLKGPRSPVYPKSETGTCPSADRGLREVL